MVYNLLDKWLYLLIAFGYFVAPGIELSQAVFIW